MVNPRHNIQSIPVDDFHHVGGDRPRQNFRGANVWASELRGAKREAHGIKQNFGAHLPIPAPSVLANKAHRRRLYHK